MSTLVALEAQLASAAQRHLQQQQQRRRGNSVRVYRGDGWVLFELPPLDDDVTTRSTTTTTTTTETTATASLLTEEVQRLCCAMAREVAEGKTRLRLSGDDADVDFAALADTTTTMTTTGADTSDRDGGGGVRQAMTMRFAQLVCATAAPLTALPSDDDVAALPTPAARRAMTRMLELLYGEAARDIAHGVRGVTAFPRLLCPSGARYDVVLRRDVCVTAYSRVRAAQLRSLGALAAAATTRTTSDVYKNNDDDDDEGGAAAQSRAAARPFESSMLMTSMTTMTTTTMSNTARAADTRGARDAPSSPQQPAEHAYVWLHTRTLAAALSSYALAGGVAEAVLPAVWRAKSFALSEASDVLRVVYEALLRYWRRQHKSNSSTSSTTRSSSSSDRVRANALSLLCIVSVELREYCKTQLQMYGTDWRGPWRAPRRTVRDAASLCDTWLAMSARLTRRDAPAWHGWNNSNSSNSNSEDRACQYRDDALVTVSRRLHDVQHVRGLLDCMTLLLLKERVPDTLQPEAIFAGIDVFDLRGGGDVAHASSSLQHHNNKSNNSNSSYVAVDAWDDGMAVFHKELSFLEPVLRSHAKALFAGSGGVDEGVVRALLHDYTPLLRLDAVRSVVARELASVAAHLTRRLDDAHARYTALAPRAPMDGTNANNDNNNDNNDSGGDVARGDVRVCAAEQQLCAARGWYTTTAALVADATRLFGGAQSPLTARVAAHAVALTRRVHADSVAVAQAWLRNVDARCAQLASLPAAVVIAATDMHSNSSSSSNFCCCTLRCAVHPQVLQYVHEVRHVRPQLLQLLAQSTGTAAANDNTTTATPRADGGNGSAHVATATTRVPSCSAAAVNTTHACVRLVDAARHVQRGVANYNTLLRRMLPCLRAVLAPAVARARLAILYADATERAVPVGNHHELRSLRLGFASAVAALSSEHAELCRVHDSILRGIAALAHVDLARGMEQWRTSVDRLRSAFDECIAQRRLSPPSCDAWRRYLDAQLYKVLELRYRHGLAELHTRLDTFAVELVCRRGGVVQFRPSLEAMREAYQVKLREFVSVPLRFRGLQAKRSKDDDNNNNSSNNSSSADSGSGGYALYPRMLYDNKERVAAVHGRAVELFAKLARVRKALRGHVALGLCGLDGAPDLDAIVEQWATQSEAASEAAADAASPTSRSARKAAKQQQQQQQQQAQPSVYVAGLQLVRERLSRLAAMDDVVRIDCFAVSTTPVKAAIDEQLHRLEDALLGSLRRSIERALTSIDAFVFAACNVIERPPTTIDEVAHASRAFRECRARLPHYERRFARAVAHNAELRAHAAAGGGGDAAAVVVVDVSATRNRCEHLRDALAAHAKVMDAAVGAMRGSLEQLVQRLLKDVQRFAGSWTKCKAALLHGLRTRVDAAALSALLATARDHVKDASELERRADELAVQCRYFNQPPPNFDALARTRRDVAALSRQWAVYDRFHDQLALLRREDWLTFRAHTYQLEDFCTTWRRELDAMHTSAGDDDDSKDSNDGGEAMVQYMRALLRDYDALTPLLRFVRGDGWMTEHWSELFRLLDLPRETTSSTSLTLGQLLDCAPALLRRRAEVQALHARAQGETQLREALLELRTWALEATFTLVTPTSHTSDNDSSNHTTAPPLKLITDWKDVMTQVSDHQALIASLKDSAFYAHFADEAAGWEAHLLTLSESLTLLHRIQRKWTYLEPIFARGTLLPPHEQARFKRVDKEFTSVLRDVAADPRVMSLTTSSPDLNERLRGMHEQLERCQRALNQYLEAKRDRFPRFYFISDDDLLEILGQSSKPEVIQAHLKKLFMGIHAVQFDRAHDDDYMDNKQGNNTTTAHCDRAPTAITALLSADGERVPLHTPVSLASADVEDWLRRLDASMQATLRDLLVRCVAELEQQQETDNDDGSNSTVVAVVKPGDTTTTRPADEQAARRLLTSSSSLLSRYPSQILQTAQQVCFARRVERALLSSPSSSLSQLSELQTTLRAQLQSLTRAAATLDADDRLARLKLKALVLDTIHHIDIVDTLLAHRVRSPEAWWWRKQLRYYLVPDNNNSNGSNSNSNNDASSSSSLVCVLRMVDAEFVYSYEYQGNAPKLVHTPLTDRCYLTLTQGMRLGYGGNPYGPAGTGKTETVKALGNAMGRQVLVFNCDEGIDFRAMGRIFVGLVKCGAWGCFDEFNRLKVDQLSAISQMIQVIQEALKSKDATCHLLGRDVDVNANAGIFVTLNPAGKGYGGRSKLPDNLKQLFREVAMSVPDDELITTTMLLAEGFVHAAALARRTVTVFTLCRELLSPQQHYDWGLRAMKAVLQLGGTLRQRYAHTTRTHDNNNNNNNNNNDNSSSSPRRDGAATSLQEESELLVQALRASTLSKLTHDDARIFHGLLRDAFAGVTLTRHIAYADLSSAIASVTRALGLQPLPAQTDKVLQLYEALRQRMGVVLVGPSGSGKSTLVRILRAALQRLGKTVPLYVVNPKAMPRQQLLGHMDADTREWFDGVLTAAARDVARLTSGSNNSNSNNSNNSNSNDVYPWIVCDGDIDPEWVESLNSVLDDNKLLTMPNGVRIQFSDRVNFLFETHSLQYASPATVSRLGVLYLAERDVDVAAVAEAAAARRGDAVRRRVLPWVMKYVFAAMDEMARMDAALLLVPMSRTACLRACLECVLDATCEAEFVFALVRGLSTLLQPAGAEQLARWLYDMSKQRPCHDARPLNTYWDAATARAVEYTGNATTTTLTLSPADLLAGAAPVVCTAEVQRLLHILTPLLQPPLPSSSLSSSQLSSSSTSRLDASQSLDDKAGNNNSNKSSSSLASVDHATTTMAHGSDDGDVCRAVFLVGPEGCGKSALLRYCLAQLPSRATTTTTATGPGDRHAAAPASVAVASNNNDDHHHASTTMRVAEIHCSAQTRASHVVQQLLQQCTLYRTTAGPVYRPRDGARLVLLLRNVHLPQPDRYGTVELHAFLHQLIVYRGFYTAELEWVGLERVQIVATMPPLVSPQQQEGAAASRDDDHDASALSSSARAVSPRLLSVVHIVGVAAPSRASQLQIYTAYWSSLLRSTGIGQGKSYDGGQLLAQCMLNVYDKLRKRFDSNSSSNDRDGGVASHAHMVFSQRQLTRWLSNVFLYVMDATSKNGSNNNTTTTVASLPAVLAYEASRVFVDSLPRLDDRGRAERVIAEQLALLSYAAPDKSQRLATLYVTWLNSNSNSNSSGDGDAADAQMDAHTHKVADDDDDDATPTPTTAVAATDTAAVSSSSSSTTSRRLQLTAQPYAALAREVAAALLRYRRAYKQLRFAILPETVAWLAYVDRALARPAGHVLLVGRPGVGRRDTLALAAYMQHMTLMTPCMTREYDLKHFRADWRAVVQRAVVQDVRTLVVLEDHQLLNNDDFVELVGLMLSVTTTTMTTTTTTSVAVTGDGAASVDGGGCVWASGAVDSAVAGLFTPEEMDVMLAGLREEAARAPASIGGGGSGGVQAFFHARLQQNVHIALVLDPCHAAFAARLRAHPALRTCCDVLWMGEWPADVSRTLCAARLRELRAAAEDNDDNTDNKDADDNNDNNDYDGEAALDLPREMLAIHASFADAATARADDDDGDGNGDNDGVDNDGKHKSIDDSNNSHVASTPQQLEAMLRTYCAIVAQKRRSGAAAVARLDAGLAKLRAAADSVAATQRDVTRKKADVETLQRAADAALNAIQQSMQDSQEQRDQASALQAQLTREQHDMADKRARVEDELGAITPLLQTAREAVRGIRAEQLHEIRSLKAPPEPVRDVLEGVLALLGVTDVSWPSMRAFLAERGAKDRILDFNVHAVTPAVRAGVTRLLQQKANSFRPDVIARASLAAAPMAEWVRAMTEYATILDRIAPLTRQLEQLETRQREGEAQLSQLQARLRDIDAHVATLRDDFAQRCRDAERLRALLHTAEADLARAEELLAKLGGEGARWAREAAALRDAQRTLPARALLAAAFVTYLAGETEAVRARWLRVWSARLLPSSSQTTTAASSQGDGAATTAAAEATCGASMTSMLSATALASGSAFAFAPFMRGERELLQYRAEGLPDDALSLENAIVVLDAVAQTPLAIDPAGQALAWLRAHLQARRVSVEVTSLHDDRVAHTLELAIRFGKTLLLTDVDAVPALLYPVLRRDLATAGAKRVVQVGGKAVEWQDAFRLVLFTRRADVALPPDAAALLTRVNFTITRDGLESQLLGLALRHERPELERRAGELLRQEEAQTQQLAELEERLLRELADAQGDLLGNAQLVQSLNDVKTQASAVHAALARAHAARGELHARREAYRPLARGAARVYFAVGDLQALNHMYAFGLDTHLALFSDTLADKDDDGDATAAGQEQAQKTNDSDDSDDDAAAVRARVARLELSFARRCFRHVAVALFKRDRLTFGLHLLRQLRPRAFPLPLWQLLVDDAALAAAAATTATTNDDAAAASATTSNGDASLRLPSWLPPLARHRCAAVARVRGGAALLSSWRLDDDAAGPHVDVDNDRGDGDDGDAAAAASGRGSWSRWFAAAAPEAALLTRWRAADDGVASSPPLLLSTASDEDNRHDDDDDDATTTTTVAGNSVMGVLLLLRLLRPDRLPALCLRVLLRELRLDALVPAQSLADALANTRADDGDTTATSAAASRPVLLVTASGADPSVEVQVAATRLVGRDHLTQIALGGGQTDEATAQLRRCAAQGGWLFLKNLHLVLDWAAVLEQELCAMPRPHDAFRLIVTTEAHDAVPSVLLRRARKLAIESPPGVKQNLARTYRTWGEDMVAAQSPHGACALFGLAWLHAVAQERRGYVPQGWTRAYDFTPADLKAATDIVVTMTTTATNSSTTTNVGRDDNDDDDKDGGGVDWTTLRGLLQNCIYGGHLDRAHDERVLELLIARTFRADTLLRATRPLCARVSAPTPCRGPDVAAWLQRRLADVDAPALLLLPDNADRVVQESAAAAQLDGLRQLTRGGVAAVAVDAAASTTTTTALRPRRGGSGGRRAAVAAALALWKDSGLASAVVVGGGGGAAAASSRRIAASDADPDPMAVFFVSEANALARLVGDLAASFAALRAAGDGDAAATVTARLRAEACVWARGRVPARWAGRMDDGPREAASWLALLARRHAAVTTTLSALMATTTTTAAASSSATTTSAAFATMAATTTYDLVALLRPHAFLDALRQYTARRCGVALVDLVLVACVGETAVTRSLPLRVRAAAAGVALQGAVWREDGDGGGRLQPAPANAPSTSALRGELVLGWAAAAPTRALLDAGFARVPLYSSAARRRVVCELCVPCADARERETLLCHGVACYLDGARGAW